MPSKTLIICAYLGFPQLVKIEMAFVFVFMRLGAIAEFLQYYLAFFGELIVYSLNSFPAIGVLAVLIAGLVVVGLSRAAK